MKKLLFPALTLSCLVFALTLQAQHPLKDAIALSVYSSVDPTTGKVVLNEGKALTEDENGNLVLRDDVAGILANYIGQQPESLTQNNINAGFNFNNTADNPFIRIAFTSMSGVGAVSRLTDMAMPPHSGTGVTAIADGIARFLVKRTKDELTLAFFDDFKKKVMYNEWLQRFFPITRQMLLGIDSEVYQFQIYLDALRDAFIADLKVLPGSMESYVRDDPRNLLTPARQAIAVDFFHIVQGIVQGDPPTEIIRYCADASASDIQMSVANNPDLQDIAAGLQMINLFSDAVYNPGQGKWYPGKEIRAALKDDVTMRILMGLLWHEAKKLTVTFKKGLKIEDVIGKAATAANVMDSWRKELINFSQIGSDWQKLLNERPLAPIEVSDAEGKIEIPLMDNFYRSLLTFGNMMETVNNIYGLLDSKAPPPIEPGQIQLVQQIGALNFNISRKHYSAAVGNAALVLELAFGDKFDKKGVFLKYGSFIGAVADAKDGREVENALNMFALPPGSSKAKKGEGKFSVAINAYTGGSYAAEHSANSDNSADYANVLSVAAPVGFSVNWGFGKSNNPGCLGLFFPVIDVGAVLAYRFKDDDEVQNLPPMNWKNIIAPGAYFVVDPPLWKIPLTIGIGGQMGPLLRKVEKGGTLVNKDFATYRLGAFIGVDIPISFLALKSRK